MGARTRIRSPGKTQSDPTQRETGYISFAPAAIQASDVLASLDSRRNRMPPFVSNDGGRFLYDQAVFRYQPVFSPARQVVGEGQIIKIGIFPAQAEAKAPLSAQITVASAVLQPAFERRGAISARKLGRESSRHEQRELRPRLSGFQRSRTALLTRRPWERQCRQM